MGFLLTAYCLVPTDFLLLSLDWIAGILPGRQTTQEGRCVCNSFCVEFEHRPGARMFGRSSTVRNYRLVLG